MSGHEEPVRQTPAHEKLYPVPPAFAERAHINKARYDELYRQSIESPDEFWAEQARHFLDWEQAWKRVRYSNFEKGEVRWFEGGKLNVTTNCIDRHLPQRAEQTAIVWEGDDPADQSHITYQELYSAVCRLANVLKERGVKKGDAVCIYMPMIPEAAYAMLACARIGAVHSVVFGGFSPDSPRGRIQDANCKLVITADEGVRGGKIIPLKANVDQALEHCPSVESCIVVQRTGRQVAWQEGRDLWYHQVTAAAADHCDPEVMDAEDPLFILYTSGSTGKPKGVVHTTGGYLLQAAMTHKYTFDYQDGEVFWCTADVGWVTGHTYIVYGPLANGAITLMFEGVPNYPTPSRHWEVIDKHQVSTYYTAPTVLRALMGAGDEHVKKASRKSLRLLGSVGEPINPEVWEWYHRVVGDSRCPIVDTWWQTETGAHMINALPGAIDLKPGSATLPFFGIEPAILDNEGNELSGPCSGNLAFKSSWPAQLRTVQGDHERCIETYYSQYKGYYFSGDGARRDEDGYYWITGRVDDVLNISGHRMGTAEIESALVLHDQVSEAAVVGCPHDIKGQSIYAFVTVMEGVEPSEKLQQELKELCVKEIGAIARPDFIQWASGLPKTRSGKIMRRILRKIAANELDDLGDLTTLADPSVVDDLVEHRLLR